MLDPRATAVCITSDPLQLQFKFDCAFYSSMVCVCSRVPHISVLREVHLQNLCAHLKRCEQNKTAADTHTHM